MAITYTWAVTSIKKDPNDSVVQTYWTKTGTDDDGNTGTFAGATPFEADPSSEDYIPFADLTESDVLSWIQPLVTGSYEDHVNAQIQKQIDANLIFDTDMPWAPSTEE